MLVQFVSFLTSLVGRSPLEMVVTIHLPKQNPGGRAPWEIPRGPGKTFTLTLRAIEATQHFPGCTPLTQW